MKGILIVDDDGDFAQLLMRSLRKAGHLAVWAKHGEEALEKLANGFEPAIAIVDVIMPGMSGAELVASLRAARPDLPILVMSEGDQPANPFGWVAFRSKATPHADVIATIHKYTR